MSWIKIMKDNKEYLVSHESYNELFRHQGYTIIGEKPSPTLKNSKETIETKKEPEGVKNELQSKSPSGTSKAKSKAKV